MKLLPDNLIAWGTIASAVLTAGGLAVAAVGYAVHLDDSIADCRKGIDRLEVRSNAMGEDVTKTREALAQLQGELKTGARGLGLGAGTDERQARREP